ncbi:MAG TPA: tetratricopeptide repeat protein [Pyrinomonadaceae bacterium]|nr:tetratricopeptide repeat protein [Pyrinomonadaceae bacterium]
MSIWKITHTANGISEIRLATNFGPIVLRAKITTILHVVDHAFTTKANATAAHSSRFLASQTILRTGWPAICKMRARSPPTFPLIRVIACVVLDPFSHSLQSMLRAMFTLEKKPGRYNKCLTGHGSVAPIVPGDLRGAIEDFTQALAFNPPNDFLLSMIYANRGYGLMLQGRKNEAQSDFEKGLKRSSGDRVIIELHLRNIETQIKEMRRRRAEAQRNIS